MKESIIIQQTVNDQLREYFVVGTKVTTLKNPIIPIERSANLEHELKKSEIATKLLYDGHSIVINGKLINNQKPDIVVLGLKKPICYEIMNTEDVLRTTKDYPFEIKEVKCK
ncbi:MAG: hypothetical protein ACTSX6_04600 [Candidatus Heimdallarchaeaceae archaeon]